MLGSEAPGSRNNDLGTAAEGWVAADLRRSGWDAEQTGQLNTIVDVKATKGRRKWYIQVKASADGPPEWPSGSDLGRLRRVATRYDGRAVVALVTVNRARKTYSIQYLYARNRHLAQP